MIALLAALLLSPTPPADPLGARIAESAQAAQTRQGPLDGAWDLRDAKGRKVLILNIVDPAGGGPLAAAWREPGEGGASGYVDAIERTAGGLTFVFTRPGAAEATRVRLQTTRGGADGWVSEGGKGRFVRLLRHNT